MATMLLLFAEFVSFDLFLPKFFWHTSVETGSVLGFLSSTSLDLLILTFSFLSSFTENLKVALLTSLHRGKTLQDLSSSHTDFAHPLTAPQLLGSLPTRLDVVQAVEALATVFCVEAAL